jgi:hypothetical protein
VAISSPGPAARYARSTKNLVGMSLAVAGPVLALAGLVAPPIGLALIPALYAVGALAAPAQKKVELASGLDAGDVRKSLETIERRVHGHVPSEIEERVRRIATTITDTLPRANELGNGSNALYVLVKTATDYLPSSLQAYLDLPRSYADRKVLSDGKTARALLCEQLDMLDGQMDEVADAVHRSDADKLVANGRFLAEKFGSGPLDVSNAPQVPESSSAPPPPGDTPDAS